MGTRAYVRFLGYQGCEGYYSCCLPQDSSLDVAVMGLDSSRWTWGCVECGHSFRIHFPQGEMHPLVAALAIGLGTMTVAAIVAATFFYKRYPRFQCPPRKVGLCVTRLQGCPQTAIYYPVAVGASGVGQRDPYWRSQLIAGLTLSLHPPSTSPNISLGLWR